MNNVKKGGFFFTFALVASLTYFNTNVNLENESGSSAQLSSLKLASAQSEYNLAYDLQTGCDQAGTTCRKR